MAASNSFCCVCNRRHVYKVPIVWCPECDEGLCTECEEHHSLSKSSINHDTIPISEYQKLPPVVLNISQYCKIHNHKYQIYCKKHESSCCSFCIVESHNECRNIVKLVEVIKNVKTSNAFYKIEQVFVDFLDNIKNIRENHEDNMASLSEQKTTIEQEIEQTRKTINNHLDKIKGEMINELSKVEKQANKEIYQHVSFLNEKENEISEYQRNISSIKQHASDLQAFLYVKQLEKDVLVKDKYIQSLIDNNTLKQYSLLYHPNSSLQNFVLNAKTFGHVLFETKLHDIVLNRVKRKQAQISMSKIEYESIEDINLMLYRKIKKPGGCNFACRLFQDGKMAFMCGPSGVTILKKDGSRDIDLQTSHYAHDAVILNESNTLVVTEGGSGSKCISFIDMKDGKLKKTLHLDSNVYGITRKDAELIYSAGKHGIRKISLLDQSKLIVKENIPSSGCIATFANNIYHTTDSTNAVTCFDLHGNIQWTFKNEAVLKYPFGLSVDSYGNVFVAGYHSCNVIVVSADGKKYKQLLSSKDGLCNPNGLHFDPLSKQMLVSNQNTGQAYVYSLVRKKECNN